MDLEGKRCHPIAVFMAFGTKGDVHPIAAVAAAFACDQRQYEVNFITHSAHQDLAEHLAERNVRYISVSSPPVLSPPVTDDDTDGSAAVSFSIKKKTVTRELRQQCLSIMVNIFRDGATVKGDFAVINFFALEGWSLAELFRIPCAVAAPYIVNYTAPASFERQFRRERPLLYRYLQEAPAGKLNWKDVIHWMWPLFSEDMESWRRDELQLSPCPFTDPVTDLPMWHDRPSSPLLLYGFSGEVVESPNYWPPNSKVCGFWFLPAMWQFSCNNCKNIFDLDTELCTSHNRLQRFLGTHLSMPLAFVGLNSIGSMGLLRNPKALLRNLQATLDIVSCRFILFTCGYEPLDLCVQDIATEENAICTDQTISQGGGSLFNGRLFCFSGSIPYSWLFQKCSVVIHHGGSGSTAAALKAGVPQVLCPFMLDQFYWADKMSWLGVAPQPLQRKHLLPEDCEDMSIRDGATTLAKAINYALRPEVKACAVEISEKISQEDGVLEAVISIKKEFSH